MCKGLLIFFLALLWIASAGLTKFSTAAEEDLAAGGDAPQARDDSFEARLDAPLVVEGPGLLANDQIPAGSSAIPILVEAPRNGSLDLRPDGSFTYIADVEFSGIDRFTYRLFDGIRLSETATVSIIVPEVEPEPPAAHIAALEPDFTPRLAAIDDFGETVDGVSLYWEKAYYQDLNISGSSLMEIPFGLNLPKDYDPEAKIRYPLVVELHGLGSRSNWASSDPDPDLRDHSLVNVPLFSTRARFFASAAQTNPPYYAFVLVPQVASKSHMWVGTGPVAPYMQTDTPGNTYSEYMHLLENLLAFLADSANNASLLTEVGLDARDIDPGRIYMIGSSDGARGAWDILARQPLFFAGAAASAGTGPENRLEELRQTPIWTIHGILDDSVPNALPSEMPPVGSGTLGMLGLLDPSFDNTASSDLVYKDDHTTADDDPFPTDTLIYTEFDSSYNHTEVAVGWTDMVSGILPWLFAQSLEEPRNNAPVAEDQEVVAAENTPVDITLKATDADGDPLVYRVVEPPADGGLSGKPPQLTYTPDAGFTGLDKFTFIADDGRDESELAVVTVTVTTLVSVVPDVAGDHVETAGITIEEAGLKVGKILLETSDSIPPDYVIRQSPEAGTEVAPGSKVDLTVALEPATFTLTVESAGSGFGTVGGGGTFEVNTIVTPTAVADPGSLFTGWVPAFCGSPFPLAEDTLCVATFVPDDPAEGITADGDVAPLGQRDGLVTIADALLTLRFALGTATPSSEDIDHADVAPLDVAGRPDPDGVINAADALIILRKASGLVDW